jgi:hypothetical protein
VESSSDDMNVSGTQVTAAQVATTATPMRADATASAPLLPKLYLRKNELATWANVSERTINNRMKRRIIPFVKVGRTILFRLDAADKSLQRFTVRAVGDDRIA